MGFPGLELKIRMSLVAGPDLRVFVPVRLYYKNTDPYAVQFSFDVTPDDVVRWTFARELLDQGLTAPAGIGDVKITPIGPHQNRRLRIELESPDGYARLEGPAAPIKEWLAETYTAVAAGQESKAVDIDSLLDKFLTRCQRKSSTARRPTARGPGPGTGKPTPPRHTGGTQHTHDTPTSIPAKEQARGQPLPPPRTHPALHRCAVGYRDRGHRHHSPHSRRMRGFRHRS